MEIVVILKNQKKLTNNISCQMNTMQSSNWFPDHIASESRDLQLNYNNLTVIIEWKEKNIQLAWAEISKFNYELKSLWPQWDRIQLID